VASIPISLILRETVPWVRIPLSPPVWPVNMLLLIALFINLADWSPNWYPSAGTGN